MTHSIKISDLSCLNGLPFGESFDTLISEGEARAEPVGFLGGDLCLNVLIPSFLFLAPAAVALSLNLLLSVGNLTVKTVQRKSKARPLVKAKLCL